MPKAYSYMRFSTSSQATGDSKRRQYKQAEEYAAANGLVLDDTLRYNDYGVSAFRGANIEIGKLGQFMEAIRRGEVECGSLLLVESLDRISRDLILPAQNIFTQIILEGVTIVTLADKRIYSMELVNKYPFLLIEAIVILIRANEESETKSMRSKANWENRRANLATKPMTTLIPAWIKLHSESYKFEVIPERGTIIERIYRERLDGKSTRNIARGLDEDNIPTWITCNRKRAIVWSHHYVWRILSTPSVIGTLVPRKVEYCEGKEKRIPLTQVKGYYPAAISEELYNSVQEINPRFSLFPKGKAPFKNIFFKIGKCAHCGLRLDHNAKSRYWSSLSCVNTECERGLNKPIAYPRLQAVFLTEFISALFALSPTYSATNKYHNDIVGELLKFMRLRHRLERRKAIGIINDDTNTLEDSIRKSQFKLKLLFTQSLGIEYNKIDVVSKDFIDASISKHFKPDQINKMLQAMCDKILISSGNIEVKFKSRHTLHIEYDDTKWSRFTYAS